MKHEEFHEILMLTALIDLRDSFAFHVVRVFLIKSLSDTWI